MAAFERPGDGDEREQSDDVAAYAETLQLLGHQRRIHTLLCLREESPTTVEELSASVAEREWGVPRDQVPQSGVRRVQSALHHVHLPKLRTAGAIEFDPGRGVVELADDLGDVSDVLDALIEV